MKFYKFRSLESFEYTADILVNQRLFCAPFYKLNDPLEGVYWHADTFEWESNEYSFLFNGPAIRCIEDQMNAEDYVAIRVCCMCAGFDDIRMWSHYADDHKGLAIEIEVDEDAENIHKIEYEKELLRFESKKYAAPSAFEILSRKTKMWDHEKEYRVIGTDDYFSVEGKIKRVILGPNFSRDNCEIIRKLIPDGVEIVQARLDYENLKVVVP